MNATMQSDGKVLTNQSGKYVVLGWHGVTNPMGWINETELSWRGIPRVLWEENEIVGTTTNKKDAHIIECYLIQNRIKHSRECKLLL